MFGIAQQWANRAVQSDNRQDYGDAVHSYQQAATALEVAIASEPNPQKRQQAQGVVASYRNRAAQLSQTMRPAAPPVRVQVSAPRPAALAQDLRHCEDAESQALIASILEEERRALARQREVDERKSIELAEKMIKEEKGDLRSPSNKEPQPSSPQRAQDPTSLLAFLDVNPESKDTFVESIIIRSGGKTFKGSFSLPTKALQKYLRRRLDRESAREGRKEGNKGGEGGRGKGADDFDNSDDDDDDGGHSGPSNSLNTIGEAAQNVRVNAAGVIVGGQQDYHQDSAVQRPDSFDSGRRTSQREVDWEQLVRQHDRPRGPPQVPRAERIALSDRNKQIEISREALRVNPPSDRRLYDLEGYETESYIDPRRTIDVPIAKSSAPRSAPPVATHAAVLFETAAVGAKIRNVHKMGGERVKEMDHFVASVETPVLTVKIPDIAQFVVTEACAGAAPVRIADAAFGDFDVYPQSHLRTEAGVADEVAVCARAFVRLLKTICEQLLGLSFASLRLYYMVTIRADACVCQRSATDGLIYINLMVFQQQAAHDPRTLAITGGRRIWQYWLQRVAMASTPPDQPTGLYHPEIRRRFKDFAARLPQPVAVMASR